MNGNWADNQKTAASFRIGDIVFESQVLVVNVQKYVIYNVTVMNFCFKLDLQSEILS